ncbi:beta-ketoacyl synthase N-terminal-like domain-containing protein [Saccharopolyspora sp. NPDC000995]
MEPGDRRAVQNVRSLLPARPSHLFDLRGPSVTVGTACSSSLVAVHQAVQTGSSSADPAMTEIAHRYRTDSVLADIGIGSLAKLQLLIELK